MFFSTEIHFICQCFFIYGNNLLVSSSVNNGRGKFSRGISVYPHLIAVHSGIVDQERHIHFPVNRVSSRVRQVPLVVDILLQRFRKTSQRKYSFLGVDNLLKRTGITYVSMQRKICNKLFLGNIYQ